MLLVSLSDVIGTFGHQESSRSRSTRIQDRHGNDRAGFSSSRDHLPGRFQDCSEERKLRSEGQRMKVWAVTLDVSILNSTAFETVRACGRVDTFVNLFGVVI